MRIWMVASENGALKGGKVGGVGDVIRDLPQALAAEGHEVAVFTPAYGVFHRQTGAARVASIKLSFGGKPRVAALHRLSRPGAAVAQYAIEHSLMTVGHPGRIYHDDGADAPFATDASRFAFFSAAMAGLVQQAPAPPDVMHLHDWHTGMLFFLRRFAPGLGRLKKVRCVFSIHNLAYQGIRPLAGHGSSLEAWFPGIRFRTGKVVDPRYPDCINLMATAIRLADKINTVSPGYAREILKPSDAKRGFIGGEGLEADLQRAAGAGRLVGILNGCNYAAPALRRPGWDRLLAAIAAEKHLFKDNPGALARLRRMPRKRPSTLMLSIGRVTEQKSALFLQQTSAGQTALEHILALPGREFMLIMLGSGDPAMERQLADISDRHRNFMFLRGYAESLPDLLYAAGDLFLMPSSFEPCGISQMLAMRAGQPCVAHGVGGLRDTIRNGQTGFTFAGASPRAQARQFVAAVERALHLKTEQPRQWQDMREAAAAERFTWESSARNYRAQLYAG